ncbi:MAG: DUF4136 domain-containing protein [Acidiferrobacterales bacterium]
MSLTFRSLLVIIALFTACAAKIKVATEHDLAADFSNLKTYAWFPGSTKGGTLAGIIRNEFVHATVRSAVETQLARKGYERILSGTPDFWIRYYAALRTRLVVQTEYDSRLGGLSELQRGAVLERPPQSRTAEFNEGTLALDVINPETNKLMWRGTAKTKINVNASDRKQEARINKIARKLLVQFPPKKN